MATARLRHTATLLPSGQVLALGGYYFDDNLRRLVYELTPELYDSGMNSWTRAGSVVTNRHDHTATLLRNGQVLVIGGGGPKAAATAERYDPVNKSSIRAAAMATARFGGHTATLLRDGQVLLLGGDDLATAELYNPDKNRWVTVKSMTTDRRAHSATLLANGQVLVVGGRSGNDVLATAERYDTTTNSWASAGKIAMGREAHTATLLANGQVLVVGGLGNMGKNFFGLIIWRSLATAELYDPTANTWISAGTMATARSSHTETLLPNGQVLVIGGEDSGPSSKYPDALERYDPTTNSWASAGRMATERKNHTATLLPSGQVLVTGGYTDRNPGFLATAELCGP
jgi:N-acetylneuraminic acid mutarotase